MKNKPAPQSSSSSAAQPSAAQPQTLECYGRPTLINNTLIMKGSEPSCFNGEVHVARYRVTIEPVEEAPEVLADRVEKMYLESDNHHHRTTLVSFWRKSRKTVKGWPDREMSLKRARGATAAERR
jgi:hypothetical protein